MFTPGDLVELVPEKPAAGGTMLARHEGLVVLVAGAIPGEHVRVRIDRLGKGVAYASVVEVLAPHPDRRPVTGDPACGGAAYAHITYPAQVRLKGEVIRDGLERLARVAWPSSIDVEPSPERGYRMRARLHVRDGRLGFLREGTHHLCDAAVTDQLLPETNEALAVFAAALHRAGQRGEATLELSENIPGDERALHLDLADGARLPSPKLLGSLPGVTGLTWTRPEDDHVRLAQGSPIVADEISVPTLDGTGRPVRLQRHVRAFFQGNRYLVPQLVAGVIEACPDGPVLDLYAGAGLLGVCLAATGRHQVTAVEGHATTAEDLAANAAPFAACLFVRHLPVERYLRGIRPGEVATLILDPPRTGMSRDACQGALALGAPHVVFVSCDVATLARDVCRFLAAGYQLASIRGFDLFPGTPHVEALAVLTRS